LLAEQENNNKDNQMIRTVKNFDFTILTF
jgi:hypothetical protein